MGKGTTIRAIVSVWKRSGLCLTSSCYEEKLYFYAFALVIDSSIKTRNALRFRKGGVRFSFAHIEKDADINPDLSVL